MTNVEEIESILEVYTIEEILEQNDISLVDAVEFLVEEGFIELPKVKPLTSKWENDPTDVKLDAYET